MIDSSSPSHLPESGNDRFRMYLPCLPIAQYARSLYIYDPRYQLLLTEKSKQQQPQIQGVISS